MAVQNASVLAHPGGVCIPLAENTSDKTFAVWFCRARPCRDRGTWQESVSASAQSFESKNSHAAWHNLGGRGCPSPRNGLGPGEKLIDSLQLVSKCPELGSCTFARLASFLADDLCVYLPRGVPRLSLAPDLQYMRPSVSPTSSLFLLSVTTFPLYSSLPFAESHHGSPHSR